MATFAFLACLAFVGPACRTPQRAGAPALAPFPGLAAGPHAVGFRSHWELDRSRTYDRVFADGSSYASSTPGAARPVLVNVWYPAMPDASSGPMRTSGLLPAAAAGADVSKGLARFARELDVYDRGVIAQEVFGAELDEFDATTRASFEAFLGAPSTCYRDAPELHGRFPLVLFHSGYGSSVDDQSLLCAQLAANGYVVVGSAYEEPSGKSFDVDAHAASLADFDFLVARARTWPNVDARRIAAVGHSGGAQAVLRWRVAPDCPALAIVSLDTTQDYYSVRDNRWDDLLEPLRAHPERIRGGILFAAAPDASFELADSLAGAERWFFTAPLDHDEFISHGFQRLACAPASPQAVERTRAAHLALARCVRAFLDQQLKGERAGLAALEHEFAVFPLDGRTAHLEHAARGALAPETCDATQPTPPTPRQLRPLLNEQGLRTTLAVLRRAHASAPEHPIFSPQLRFGWEFELVADGRLREARALHTLNLQLTPEYSQSCFGICTFDELFSREFALNAWRTFVALEPDNQAAWNRLSVLERSAR